MRVDVYKELNTAPAFPLDYDLLPRGSPQRPFPNGAFIRHVSPPAPRCYLCDAGDIGFQSPGHYL